MFTLTVKRGLFMLFNVFSFLSIITMTVHLIHISPTATSVHYPHFAYKAEGSSTHSIPVTPVKARRTASQNTDISN